MTKRLIATLALLAAFGLPSTVLAQTATDQDQTYQDKDKWQVKDGYEYRVFPLRPTQWPDGVETAPENCVLTPAQAHKYKCKTISYQGRAYYYYTGEHGKIYARRAAVVTYTQPTDAH